MMLRLATYNIHRCVGGDGRLDTGRIAHVISDLAADAVALQEVEMNYAGGGQIAELADRTGMAAVPGPTLPSPQGDYGNAVLSRLPVGAVHRLDLSFQRREPRGALDVTLEVPHHQLRLVATHLGLRPAERRFQVRQLLDHFRGVPAEIPIVLAGDLNEWLLWGRPLRWLKEHFGRGHRSGTFPARWPVLALDRIWVHPAVALVDVAVHDTTLARRASDHLPLVANVDLTRLGDTAAEYRHAAGAGGGIP